MDGTVADFGSAFRAVETRLFGVDAKGDAGEPEREEEAQELIERGRSDRDLERITKDRLTSVRQERRRRDAVWKAIQSVENFWETLEPIDPEAVKRIHLLMIEHRWEVFFITQRPHTAGDTVQRQTQRWLVKQGFDLPSVLVLGGSRGAAAAAIRLDYHVDDSAQNCLDVRSDSRARPILIAATTDDATSVSSRKLGIATVSNIDQALELLHQASVGHSESRLLAKLAAIVGWK
jgi:hypothetical protein